MSSHRLSLVLLLLAFAGSAILAWQFWPNAMPLLPLLALAASIVSMTFRHRGAYGLGQLAFFVLFLFAVAHVVGDPEASFFQYEGAPRFLGLTVVCAVYLGLAWVLKRGEREHCRSGA